MNRHLMVIVLLTILFSCSEKQQNKGGTISKSSVPITRTEVKQESTQKKKSPTTPTIFFIKDSTKYSAEFLKEFKERHSFYETIFLIEDTIIVNKDRENTIIIPTDLPLNQKINYNSIPLDKKWFTMTVERINYSTIKYEVYQNERKILKKGMANLEPVFYYGAEGSFEDKDGRIYSMNEYIDNSEKICTMTILVGVGNINQAIFQYTCDSDQGVMVTETLYKR